VSRSEIYKSSEINEDILSELKIKPAVKKIQNYKKRVHHIRLMDKDPTLNYEM